MPSRWGGIKALAGLELDTRDHDVDMVPVVHGQVGVLVRVHTGKSYTLKLV